MGEAGGHEYKSQKLVSGPLRRHDDCGKPDSDQEVGGSDMQGSGRRSS